MTLIVDKLTVRRGERTILSALSFVADRGKALVLTGPNGAGKSTLLRTLAGLLPFHGGRIRLDERENEAGSGLREHCHFVGHLNGIRPSLTVAENAEFWAAFLGGPQGSARSALETFRLTDLDRIRAADLSAGQKRRLALSRVLLAPRPVWLLDEPAASLDGASLALLAEVVGQHLGRGGIVVAATHQPLGFDPVGELHLTDQLRGSTAPDRTASDTHLRTV